MHFTFSECGVDRIRTMRLLQHCTLCNKPLEILSESLLNETERLVSYKCGHTFILPIEKISTEVTLRKSIKEDKEAYPFQVEGIQFAAASNFNCLIADPMGLGKTIQALLAYRNNVEKLGPALIVVKSATIWQWLGEYKEWCDPTPLGIFMIQGSKGIIPPGFKTYIISMDTFSRLVKPLSDFTKKTKGPENWNGLAKFKIEPQLDSLNIRTIIVDESHSFKNPESARSAALVAYVDQKKIQHKIFLSGTPIKNRADEYFVPLNLLDPEHFPSLKRFRNNFLLQNPVTGKFDRVAPWAKETFDTLLSKYVIRREKNEVLSLPPFRRTFETIYIDDENMKIAYNKELEKLRETTDSKAEVSFLDISEHLMTLRRITGMAKVSFALNYVDTFLDTVEDEKIAIGVHHQAVRDSIYYGLEQRGFLPLKLSGEDSAERKNQILKEFEKPGRRILVVNMLAGGVGLNIQCCNNALILERQWNAADEEQFEGRFHRNGQTRPVLAEYMIAKDTVDDYFSQMVEHKRKVCGETLDGWSFTQDSNAIKELVQQTLGSRLK